MKSGRVFRPLNLALIALIQTVIQYNVIRPEINDQAKLFTHWQFGLIAAVTVLLGASGFLINDLFDTKIDAFNRPDSNPIGAEISRKNANILYWMLVIAGLVLTWLIGEPYRWPGIGVYAFSVFALYTYSSHLKKLPLIGNILVAAYCAFVVYVLWLGQATTFSESVDTSKPYMVVVLYTVLAFFATLSREIIKDIEDLSGDVAFGARTLPAVIGTKRAQYVSITLNAIMASLVVFCLYRLNNIIPFTATVYMAATVVVPMILISFKTLTAQSSKDHHRLSQYLKGVLITGTVFLIFI